MAFRIPSSGIRIDGGKISEDDPMPFGKHRGTVIKDVPRDYLLWAVDKADFCNPDHSRYWEDLHKIFYKVLYGKDLDTPPPNSSVIPPTATPNSGNASHAQQNGQSKSAGHVTRVNHNQDPNPLSFPVFCRTLENIGIKIRIVEIDGIWTVEPSKKLLNERLQYCLNAYQDDFLGAARCLDIQSKPQEQKSTSSVPQSKRILIAGEIRAIVKRWYRQMSAQHHPDTGGSVVGQSAVNACYSSLMKLLEGWEGKKDG